MGAHLAVRPLINSAVSCFDIGFETILPSKTRFLMSGSVSALMSALTEPEVKKVVLQGNMVSKPMSKQETAEFIKGLTVKWSPIVKSLNISLD